VCIREEYSISIVNITIAMCVSERMHCFKIGLDSFPPLKVSVAPRSTVGNYAVLLPGATVREGQHIPPFAVLTRRRLVEQLAPLDPDRLIGWATEVRMRHRLAYLQSVQAFPEVPDGIDGGSPRTARHTSSSPTARKAANSAKKGHKRTSSQEKVTRIGTEGFGLTRLSRGLSEQGYSIGLEESFTNYFEGVDESELEKSANLRLVRAFGNLKRIVLSKGCTFYCRPWGAPLLVACGDEHSITIESESFIHHSTQLHATGGSISIAKHCDVSWRSAFLTRLGPGTSPSSMSHPATPWTLGDLEDDQGEGENQAVVSASAPSRISSMASLSSISSIATSETGRSEEGGEPEPEEALTEGSIHLEEQVWIGAMVILLPGTRIGQGSIVAAGSVVQGDFPPWSIIAGHPATVKSTIQPFEGSHGSTPTPWTLRQDPQPVSPALQLRRMCSGDM